MLGKYQVQKDAEPLAVSEPPSQQATGADGQVPEHESENKQKKADSTRPPPEAALREESLTANGTQPIQLPNMTRAFADTNSAVSDGGLGAILKGSAFEPSPSEAAAAAETAHKKSSAPSKTNAPSKPASQSTSLGKKMEEASKNPHPRAPPKGEFIANKNAISTKPLGGRIHPSVSTKSPTTPKSPSQKTPVSPKQQRPEPKDAPKKPSVTNESSKKATTATQKSPSQPKAPRASLASAATKPTRETKSSVSGDVPKTNGVRKDATKTSPDSKPRPRSPTRPVRLPAAATAPTSASAAKTSEGAHHISSRVSLGAAAPTKKASSTQLSKPTASLATKTSRASLASQSGAQDRPKSRMSIAGKAPAEGFLARMTRPTTSSAQKVHEKVQPNSPPRDHKSMAKSSSRKSLAKAEDDKETIAETDRGGGPDLGSDGKDESVRKNETAQPPAADATPKAQES